jgi:hypothetical protein
LFVGQHLSNCVVRLLTLILKIASKLAAFPATELAALFAVTKIDAILLKYRCLAFETRLEYGPQCLYLLVSQFQILDNLLKPLLSLVLDLFTILRYRNATKKQRRCGYKCQK